MIFLVLIQNDQLSNTHTFKENQLQQQSDGDNSISYIKKKKTDQNKSKFFNLSKNIYVAVSGEKKITINIKTPLKESKTFPKREEQNKDKENPDLQTK